MQILACAIEGNCIVRGLTCTENPLTVLLSSRCLAWAAAWLHLYLTRPYPLPAPVTSLATRKLSPTRP